MMRCLLLCLVGALLSCASLTAARAAVTPSPVVSSVAADRLGGQTLSILSGATRVQTFRIGLPPPFGQPYVNARIDHRLLSTDGRTEDHAFAAKLTTILLDPRLYPNMRDRCLFDPGVLFRVWRGKASVDCLFCFHCDDILVLTRDAQGRTVHTAFTHFGPLRPKLLALAKQALPSDQEIQGLPAN